MSDIQFITVEESAFPKGFAIGNDLQIHKLDCRDLKKVHQPSILDNAIIENFAMMGTADLHFMPCFEATRKSRHK